MGLLSKLGNAFIEEVPGGMIMENEVEENRCEPVVTAELDGVRADSLIGDIYDRNGLGNTDESIFKVEEVINSLPKEMSTTTKKTTLLSILASFQITPISVSLDGDKRIDTLNEVLSVIIRDNDILVSQANVMIEDHKKEIEALEKKISINLQETRDSEEKIKTEVERIKRLISFIGGEE